MLVQNSSKNANWGRGVIFPKYQPEISYLDPIQPIFDKSCKHVLLKFLENPHKSPLQGSGSSRTMIFPIIAPTKMSKSGIGLTWGPIFEIQKKGSKGAVFSEIESSQNILILFGIFLGISG